RLHELDLGRDAACEVHAWGVQNFTDRHDRKIRASRGDHASRVLAACRGLDVDLFRDAEPRKKIVRKPDTARASGDRDGFGLEQDCSSSFFRRWRPPLWGVSPDVTTYQTNTGVKRHGRNEL